MARSTSVEVRTYRDHWLELRDDGGMGWIVAIYPPPEHGPSPEVLRNGAPNGLATLLSEAQRRVDKRLDGALDGEPRGLWPTAVTA